MNGTRKVAVDMRGTDLAAGETLAFRLLPAEGDPDWEFACLDGRIFHDQNHPRPEYRWYVGSPLVGISDGPLFRPHRPAHVADVYLVRIHFARCPSYRLEIMKLPQRVIVLDITYTNSNTAAEFTEPFTVTAV